MTAREMLIVLQQARVLQAALQEAKTEAATSRIENARLRDALRVAREGLHAAAETMESGTGRQLVESCQRARALAASLLAEPQPIERRK